MKLNKRNKLPSSGRGAREGGITNIQRYKINTLEKEIKLPVAEVVPDITRAVVEPSLPRTCSRGRLGNTLEMEGGSKVIALVSGVLRD
jgi:hypothetical protein